VLASHHSWWILLPPTKNAVVNVLFLTPNAEVIWIYAGFVVAGVPDNHVWRGVHQKARNQSVFPAD